MFSQIQITIVKFEDIQFSDIQNDINTSKEILKFLFFSFLIFMKHSCLRIPKNIILYMDVSYVTIEKEIKTY